MISERISDDIPPKTSQKENFEYGYPHSNALLLFRLKSVHKVARRQTKCDVIHDVKLFPTVYRRIYCHKFLTVYPIRRRVTKSSALE